MTELIKELIQLYLFLSDLARLKRRVGKLYAASLLTLAADSVKEVLDRHNAESYVFLDLHKDPYGFFNERKESDISAEDYRHIYTK